MENTLVYLTPALIGGGIEKSTPLLLKHLKEMLDVQIIWIGINRSSYDDELKGIDFFSLNRDSKDGLRKTVMAIYRIRKIVKKYSNCVVIGNGEMAEIAMVFQPLRPPQICIEHASKPWSRHRMLGFFVRSLLKLRTVQWMSVNKNQKKIWPFISKFGAIPNPIEIPHYLSKDDSQGIVAIGRLNEDKNVEMICEASTRSKISLDVYGDGPLMSQLKKDFKMSPWIRFHGYRNDPWDFVGRNKTLVSCSSHEGDGRVIVETIIRRQPILLIDTPDHRKFDLPEHHYFSNLEELIEKLVTYFDEQLDEIRPPKHISDEEMVNRDPIKVASILKTKLIELFDIS